MEHTEKLMKVKEVPTHTREGEGHFQAQTAVEERERERLLF